MIYQTICPTYDPDRLIAEVRDHLDRHMAGRDLNGKKVLLKVNLLSGKEPEKAVTTHPEFLRAVITVLQDCGAECIIGDSPGGPFTEDALMSSYRKAGYDKVASDTGATLNMDVSGSELPIPRGRFIRRIAIADYVRNADIVIALPKLKTHTLTGLTCSTKIMFGAVPGLEKVKLHGRFQSPIEFSKMLLDLSEFVKPDMFIVDGIIGMEGQGPARGRPRKVGIIISGIDPIEIDLQACRVVGLDAGKIPIFAAYRDLYKVRLPDPEIIGAGADFKLDPPFVPAKGWSVSMVPTKMLSRAVRSLLSGRPVISQDLCRGCKSCVDNCASNAITVEGDIAVIDGSKCIRCYCCHELCPYGAVEIKAPPRIAGAMMDAIFNMKGE